MFHFTGEIVRQGFYYCYYLSFVIYFLPDVNVENAQLLLLLFHGLPLLQKKMLLLQLGQRVITIADRLEKELV